MKHQLTSLVVLLVAPLFAVETARKTCAPLMMDASEAAFPTIATACGEQVAYVGAYFADSKYRTGLAESSLAQEMSTRSQGMRPAEVPSNVELYARELSVTQVRSGETLRQNARRHSFLAEWRDGLLTAVYGHQQVIQEPQYVTTDTRGRVIVSDPAGHAVHVLDSAQPFRIVTGPRYRLINPGAVATDAEDNIYVADPVMGVVAVFDASGRFLRELGKIGENEGVFYRAISLAMDRERGELYVADQGRQMVLVLDLSGRVLHRIGGAKQEKGATLQKPTAVAVTRDEIVVLDKDASRLQVFDRDFQLVRVIETELRSQASVGLDVDTAGNIYVSGATPGRIRVFSGRGALKGEFGRPGEKRGDLNAPTGLHIDDDKMYVTDAVNRRVVVMQISFSQAPIVANLQTP